MGSGVKKFIITCILFYVNNELMASSKCQHNENSFKCVKFVRNYDADTITVNIPGLHALIGNKVSIRVRGIDTPELRTKNSCEKKQGYKARDYVHKILATADRIDLLNIGRGKYFRIVADVIVDGNSLGQLLLNKGFAYKYGGGTKIKYDWCKSHNEQRLSH